MIKWYCQRNSETFNGKPLYKGFPVQDGSRYSNNRKTVVYDDFAYHEHTEYCSDDVLHGYIHQFKLDEHNYSNFKSNTYPEFVFYLENDDVYVKCAGRIENVIYIVQNCYIDNGHIVQPLTISFCHKDYFIDIYQPDNELELIAGNMYQIVLYGDNQLYLGKFKADKNTIHEEFGDISGKTYHAFIDWNDKTIDSYNINLYRSKPKIRSYMMVDSLSRLANREQLKTSNGSIGCGGLQGTLDMNMKNKTFTYY